jgi:RHS repeat-associated protein
VAGAVVSGFDAQDRVASFGETTFRYTPDGYVSRRVLGGDTTRYTFAARGELSGVALPQGTQLRYIVDGLGRRIGKRRNGMFVRGWLYGEQLNPAAEVDSTGQILSQFIYVGNGRVPAYMAKGSQTYRIVTDQLGSVRLVVNSQTGAIAQQLEFDAYGRVTLNSNPGFQPFGFAGGLLDDDSGLTHFGSREYDAMIGRWISRDPIGFEGGDANLYAYAFNDPINITDPTGLFSLPEQNEATEQNAIVEQQQVSAIRNALQAAGQLKARLIYATMVRATWFATEALLIASGGSTPMAGAVAHWAARLAVSGVFKLLTVREVRALIFSRNLREYSSVWGATFSDMLAQYGTWEEIIAASFRVNIGIMP